ncbi:MAG: ABC transporter substrate-binding protein [Dongiaceae bacterium]
MQSNIVTTRIVRAVSALTVAAFLAIVGGHAASAADQVRVAGLTWPGYGFWFIAQEKNLAPDLEIIYQTIEDPYESFALASSGQLDIVYSTIEFAPIAAAEDFPIKLVAYGNLSHGTDKIIVAPGIESAQDLRGEKVAVLEGGLAQLYMAMWLEANGVPYTEVEYVNLIMDDAATAMIGGDVKAAEFWEPFGANTLKSVEGSKIMATSADEQWEKNALIADALFMSDAFIENREVALKAMQALYDAIQWWKENPTEGNQIIAEGMKMTVEDVELVIGADGTGLDGGLYPYTFEETARFCGSMPGDPPFGQTNGQMADHWRMTNEWWIKFGLMTETLEPETGSDCTLLTDLYESGYRQ